MRLRWPPPNCARAAATTALLLLLLLPGRGILPSPVVGGESLTPTFAPHTSGSIVDFFPANQSTNVSTSVVPRIDFAYPMNRSTVAPLLTVAPYQAFTTTWSTNLSSVTISFLDPLSNETNYTVELFPGSTTANGTIVSTTFWFEFETVSPANTSRPPPPPPNPTVSSRFPSPGEVNVSVWANVSVSFDMGMNVSSAEDAISFFPQIPGRWTVELSGTFFRYPSVPLAYSTRYTVTVATNATSLDGTALQHNLTWNFTTIAQPHLATAPAPDSAPPYEIYALIGATVAVAVACGVVLMLLVRRNRAGR